MKEQPLILIFKAPSDFEYVFDAMNENILKTLEGRNIIHFLVSSDVDGIEIECINPLLVTEEEYLKTQAILEELRKKIKE